MDQYVLITGTGREQALGFNLVKRYLEAGDVVFATVRKESEALEKLREEYPGRLRILCVDIGDTKSVRRAVEEVEKYADHLDILINNAVTTAPDCQEHVLKADPDAIAPAFNIGAVGPLRMIQAFFPLLQRSVSALIVNVSSEAGSISACYRTNMVDYAMTKAALNIMTKTVANAIRPIENVHILSLHPGWMRTNEGNREAPLDPYEHAETLRLLFKERRLKPGGPLFICHDGTEYPW